MNTAVASLHILAKLGDYGADIVGAILLGLALLLFVAEIFAPTHGSVAVGGLVILVVGLSVLAQGTGSAVPGVLIVALVIGGSIWIMDHLNERMMPMDQMMNMQR